MGENRGTATLPATSLGRPLDAEISRAILEAALHILGEKGYSRLTVGEVASRAGVHKPALYRRWGSKLDLVIAAIATLAIDTHDPQTGDVRSDLTELLVASAAANAPQRLDLALRLRAELAAEPELAGAVEARIAGPRRTFNDNDTLFWRSTRGGEETFFNNCLAQRERPALVVQQFKWGAFRV